MVNQGASHEQPHVAVCSGAGMSHLAPCLSLASALSSSDCLVTLVVIIPLASSAEASEIASFLASQPSIRRLDFHMDSRPCTKSMDPFLARYDALSHSADLLGHHLPTLTPPLLAVFSEFSLTRGVNNTLPVSIPNYTIVPVSARFFSIMAWLPHMHAAAASSQIEEAAAGVKIPGIGSVPRENLPPPFFNPDHVFADLVASNARNLQLSKGIVLNTFEAFEPDELAALRGGKVVPGLPPLFPFAPLHAARKRPDQDASAVDETLTWLDSQPNGSVIYVAFGSRSVMSRDQTQELGLGLLRSGCRFVWVVKTAIVDSEEKDGLEELLGRELYQELGESAKGKLVRNWVRQDEVLGHRAVGGFLSHAGWSSVLEAARHGVPVLAWPLGGDQRENAWTVNKVGLGIWEGWGADKLVSSTEIADKVGRLMKEEEVLKRSVARIKEEAHKACQVGGSSTTALLSIVQALKG